MLAVFAFVSVCLFVGSTHGQVYMPSMLTAMANLQQPALPPVITTSPVAIRNPTAQKVFNNLNCFLENENFKINDDFICQCRSGKIVCSFPQACMGGDKRYQCPPQNIQCPSSGIVKKDCNYCYCYTGSLQCYTNYLCPKMVPPIWTSSFGIF